MVVHIENHASAVVLQSRRILVSDVMSLEKQNKVVQNDFEPEAIPNIILFGKWFMRRAEVIKINPIEKMFRFWASQKNI